MKHLFLIILITLLACVSLYSVPYIEQSLGFEHLTSKQGLSINSIFSICQDKEGFMWFDTWHGINKYDGIFLYFQARSKTAGKIVFYMMDTEWN
jgi:ligand-binding sensor domain-containing protein